MATLDLAVLCESASIDIVTNQASLFKIIEGINYAGPFPIFYPKFTLVMFWRRSGSVSRTERVTARIKISNSTPAPAGAQPLPENDFEVEIPPNINKARVISDLIGIPIYGPGTLTVLIQERHGSTWRDIRSVLVDITTQPTPERGGAIPL